METPTESKGEPRTFRTVEAPVIDGHAVVPRGYIELTVEDIEPGESFFVSQGSTALVVLDGTRKAYLHAGATLLPEDPVTRYRATAGRLGRGKEAGILYHPYLKVNRDWQGRYHAVRGAEEWDLLRRSSAKSEEQLARSVASGKLIPLATITFTGPFKINVRD